MMCAGYKDITAQESGTRETSTDHIILTNRNEHCTNNTMA